MKLFSKVKTWLATTLCATLVLSGAAAVTTLTAKATESGSATEVTVSSDIQKIVDGYNNGYLLDGANNAYFSAKYVKDYTLANGTKASGILFTADATQVSTGNTFERIYVPNVKIDARVLTSTTSTLGYIIAPEALNDGAYSSGMHIYFLGEDDTGFTYQHSIGESTDTAEESRVNTSIRRFKGGINYSAIGLYYYDNAKYSYGARGFKAVSHNGYQTKPHNVYYDYATNVLYNDYYSKHSSDCFALATVFNVDPKNYSSLNPFNPWPFSAPHENRLPTDARNLLNYTGSTAFAPFEGFANDVVKIGFRFNINVGKKTNVLITNYAGLDLTNPTNTFATEVLKADDDAPLATSEYVIKAPKYTNPIGIEKSTAFDGVVNVYKGARNYTYAYGSLGSTVANIQADLGDAIIAGKQVGDIIDLSEVGYYTLEYVATNGSVAYATINANNGLDVTSVTGVNATITKDGAPLEVGAKLAVGDVVKFTADEDFTLYNFTKTGEGAQKVLVNGVATTITDGEYVVTIDAVKAGSITFEAVAYSNIYKIRLMRLGGTSTDYNEVNFFEGVNCKYYSYYDSNMWRTQNNVAIGGERVYTYYGLFHYNGEKLFLNTPLTLSGYTTPANTENTGYALFKLSDNSPLGIVKGGLQEPNAIPIYCDTIIEPIATTSFIKTGVINTKGTKGLQVKVYVDKKSHDLFERGYYKYEKDNPYGYSAVSVSANEVHAVIVKGEYYNELSEIVKATRNLNDSYGWSTFASKDEFKGKIKVVKLTNLAADEVIEGVTYKVYSIIIAGSDKEDFTKSYYVGAYKNYASCNGGDFVRLGRAGGTSMVEHTFAAAITNMASDMRIISDKDNIDTKYYYEFNANGQYMIFGSDTYQAYELKTVGSAYVAYIYNEMISFTEVTTEGWVKHVTKDVWYNSAVEGLVDMIIDVYATL